MKLLLGAILAVALVVLGVFIYKSYKEKHRLAQTVGRVLIYGWIIVLFNLISLLTTSKLVCLIAYSAYFIASDWMLYYLLRFSLEYIGNQFERHVKKPLMIMLLVADSISITLNCVFEHLFKLQEVTLFGRELYFELEVAPLFFIHYAIVLMLVIFCLISLFYGAFTAAVFYRRKYLAIAVLMVVLIGLNILSVTSAIDVSIIGYVIEGICIYYCAFVYTPQKLLPQTLFNVAQDMSIALFVLDAEGKTIFSNKCAQQLLAMDEDMLVNVQGLTLEEWCRMQYLNSGGVFIREQSFYRGEEELILKIELHRMMDGRHHVQGGYFVVQDKTEEIMRMREEEFEATHDTLTGLYNQDYFFQKAERYIKRHPDEELLIICLDIKNFKMINDAMGTKTGDTVLINFAMILRELVDGIGIYGRLGDDVFAVLMPKAEYKETLFVSEEQELFLAGAGQDVSFPIIHYVGVYEVLERILPVSVMCDRARLAVKQIKGDYHKRIAYYDNTMRDTILYEQELISELNTAISEEQLKMYLHPQMSVDGRMLGAEALIRWEHPKKGIIMPNEFLPVFEKNGLISDVDRYIWEMACRQLQKWKQEGWNDLYISVNISPRDFYFLNIYQIFTKLVEKYDIDPKNLKLEITETAIVMDLQRQMELIKRLRKTGFIVEMDDFGSGYSSLNMLKDIHVDVLKIDMAFLKKTKEEERSKKILQMVIGLAKHLEMPVITEGVESAEQVEFLAEMGCEMFQGYYFAKPMSVKEFEEAYLKK